MEAKDYFFRLSYQQYQQKKEGEREKWESEVMIAVLKKLKEDVKLDTPTLDAYLGDVNEIDLFHSNSFKLEKLMKEIIKKEENEFIAQIFKNCWIAYWDLPDTKNACVETEPFYDGSHLIRINSELIINVSRIVWLYTTILLLEDITPYADFRDRVSLSTLKNKLLKDMKNDTDEGTSYLIDCFMSSNTKDALNKLIMVFYESALVFIVMHEVGHILELDEQACKYLNLISSKEYKDLPYAEKQRKAERNADRIGCKYSDSYISVPTFFNMGPVLVMLALAINHKNIKQKTDHPSIKSRYENALSVLFKGKKPAEVLHTRKLLYTIGKALQDEHCWSIEDGNWWMNKVSL